MQNGKLKAYIVQDQLCEHFSVTFAETSGKAKSNEINTWEFNDCEYTDLRAQRVKSWDKYADSKKIPVTELLNKCWWFECKQCRSQITQDEIDDGKAFIDESSDACDFVKGNVICAECKKKLEERGEW